MVVNCNLCGGKICLLKRDFKKMKGIEVRIGENLERVQVCYNCAKEIAEEVLNKF